MESIKRAGLKVTTQRTYSTVTSDWKTRVMHRLELLADLIQTETSNEKN